MTSLTLTIVNAKVNAKKTVPFNRAYSLLNNFQLNDIATHGKCGGKAVCGDCRVKIMSGLNYCNKPVAQEKMHFSEAELEQGWRLACQTLCLRDIQIYIPALDEIIR